MSNKIEMFSTNGTRNPNFPKKPRRYSTQDEIPESKPIHSVFNGAPDVDCSRYDGVLKAAMKEIPAGMICYQDKRYPKELRQQIEFWVNFVQGVKV